MGMIDMSEGEADYFKYRFKQYLGSVSREIQNRKLKDQEMGMTIERAQSIIQAARRNIAYFQEVTKQEKTEMTIDKSIALLTDYLEWQKLHEMDGTGVDEAINKLLEVAKKYQKIEQILKDIPYGGDATVRRIQEVVNGNDD